MTYKLFRKTECIWTTSTNQMGVLFKDKKETPFVLCSFYCLFDLILKMLTARLFPQHIVVMTILADVYLWFLWLHVLVPPSHW